MNKKTVKDLDLKGKRVLLRADFNVPIKDGEITDDNRIKQALPTIKYILEKGGKLIIFSHLSRVKNISDLETKSIRPIVVRLSELLGRKIVFIKAIQSKNLKTEIDKLKNGEILMFENTRFADVQINTETKECTIIKCESKNNPNLGAYWASLGDIFINDAFGTAHRSHASNVGIATNINETAIGLLMENELNTLANAMENTKHPFTAILGGSKVSDKIGVIEALATKADYLLIGGAMTFTFLKALGKNIGKSLYEEDKLDLAKKLLEKYSEKLILPLDVTCTKEFSNDSTPYIFDVDKIPNNLMGLDIGPKTVNLFAETIKKSKTIIWNGPMGVFEMNKFALGTIGVCNSISLLKGNDAITIVGGGDAAAAAIGLGFSDSFTHISTGGGASLEFLEGKELPALKVIDEK